MAIGCMPFVIATAGKSNFITAVTGISHEKLQVFHRWISYAFFVLALIHTFPFIVYNIYEGQMVEEWNTNVCYWTGVVAILAQAWLTFASFSPLRNWCYEWFKFSHFLAATVFMIFFFFHCDFTLTSADFFIATGVLFALSWLHRQTRVYFEHGIGLRATVSLMSNGFIRVSVPTKSTWGAGQHFFVRFLSLGMHAWTIHPFTACSLPTGRGIEESELAFYIRPQGGFTARLAKHAEAYPHSQMIVLLDGPYGGIDMAKIAECRRALVLAGGSGAGWLLPMLTAHLRMLENMGGESKPPTMRLILATRDMATRHWFEEAVAAALSSAGLSALPCTLEVEIYYTGSGEDSDSFQSGGQFLSKLDDPEKAPLEHPVIETASGSDSGTDADVIAKRIKDNAVSSCSRGRPNIRSIVAEEVTAAGPDCPLGIFVCGPLSMQSDVANAAARSELAIAKDGKRDVYLHMEHFSWA
jgi:predicted ferric reductase